MSVFPFINGDDGLLEASSNNFTLNASTILSFAENKITGIKIKGDKKAVTPMYITHITKGSALRFSIINFIIYT